MTAIEWTDVTWNPVRGCSRVSPGCENCYAERQAARPILSAPGKPYHGLVTVRSMVSGLRYDHPGAAGSWTAPRWTGKVVLDPETLTAPLRWKKPRRVFVNSMSDMFHESLTDEQIAAVFGVMAATPQHTYQVLTKRAARMARWFEWVQSRPYSRVTYCIDAAHVALGGDGASKPLNSKTPIGSPWPLRNVWLGVSVEDQQRADQRIPHVLRCPAAVRFLSVEPMIGPVNLHPWLCADGSPGRPYQQWSEMICTPRTDGIQWVIVGGESGPGARPCDLRSVASISDQCRAAGVAYFFKQVGTFPLLSLDPGCGRGGIAPGLKTWSHGLAARTCYRLADNKGGDVDELSTVYPDFAVRGVFRREWPEVKS